MGQRRIPAKNFLALEKEIMLIQHKEIGKKGMFFIEEDGAILAEIVFSHPTKDQLMIEHTQVDEELQGQNIGYELVHHTVEFARQHQLKVIPVCTFAKAIFDKKPDFKDVLAD